ncbi:MAG: RodZ domain-containing protein [Robiginitomaculum sp.]
MSVVAVNIKNSDRSIGVVMRTRREQSGASLSEISESLKIKTAYLLAIENLDKNNLPSMGYVLGFVRSYAKHLKLDVDDAISKFKSDIECPKNMGIHDCPHHVPKRKFRLPKGSYAIGLVLCSVATLVTWCGVQSDASSVVIAASAPLEASLGTSNSDTLKQSAAITKNANLVSLKAIFPSWIEVKDANGMILFSRIMVPGEIFETKRENALFLSLRDAGAIELYIGGDKIGLIGQRGQYAQNISLIDAVQKQVNRN